MHSKLPHFTSQFSPRISSVARGGGGGREGTSPPLAWKICKIARFGAFEADFCSKIKTAPPQRDLRAEVVKELPWFGRMNRVNFRFRPKNPSRFRWRPFFLEITWFWAEKSFEFPEKQSQFRINFFECDSRAMKIRLKVVYSCLTLSKKPPFPNSGYAPA